MELTQEYVKDLFDYKDGCLYWRKCKNKTRIGLRAGCVAHIKNGDRWVIRIEWVLYYSSRLIFLYHNGWLPDFIDHKNRDSMDDNIENLRAATRVQNNRNKSPKKNASSEYLGVHLLNDKPRKKSWVAAIRINKKGKHIGIFYTQEEAALAYNREAVRYFGEFANLNIISTAP